MTPTLEYRSSVEYRIAGRRLSGLAAPFNVQADIGAFSETIRPGAFTATLEARSDVVALQDHDPTRLLGRVLAGTLRLSEDARGLTFELDLPDTSAGRDVLALAERRDLGGMSFGFRATRETWPARDRRELHSVDLREVSVVSSWPAYSGTEVALRSRDACDLARRLIGPDARRRMVVTL